MFILDAYMTTIDRMYSFTNEPEMCIRVGLVSLTRCVLGYIIRFRNMISYFIMPVCLSTVYASIPDCVAGRIAHGNFSDYSIHMELAVVGMRAQKLLYCNG